MEIPLKPKSSETVTVPVLQTPILISEAGHVLNQLYPHNPFSITWFKRKAGQFKWSLRSTKENGDYDVAAFAKEWGGGGHHNASGFITKKPIWISHKKGVIP